MEVNILEGLEYGMNAPGLMWIKMILDDIADTCQAMDRIGIFLQHQVAPGRTLKLEGIADGGKDVDVQVGVPGKIFNYRPYGIVLGIDLELVKQFDLPSRGILRTKILPGDGSGEHGRTRARNMSSMEASQA